ncbi:hypothetical protein [Kitasatospora camelliae]|uniref:Uncharacterized protein n=1 Tax=Kitasatospora camelliae TaxID=3156397 RepID=A0AAU8K497_9ACTN
MNLHEWITEVVEARTRFAQKVAQEPLHDPGLVADALRRCEADRRILARHCLGTGVSFYSTACDGCGYDDCGPNVENLNDCPELLDLAHALGITDDELAALERPEPLFAIPSVKRTQATIPAEQTPATFRP